MKTEITISKFDKIWVEVDKANLAVEKYLDFLDSPFAMFRFKKRKKLKEKFEKHFGNINKMCSELTDNSSHT